MKHFLYQRWFLIALAGCLCAGLGLSEPLAPLAQWTSLRQTIVVAVMFLMALPLPTGVIWSAVRRPWSAMLATVVNFGLLPLAAWGIAVVCRRGMEMSDDMAFGMLVAAAAPCTLASAAVWTRRAGGNDAMAIIVTVVTNLICFVVTPAWLYATIGRMPHFDPVSMMAKLGLLVVLPIVLAQLLRAIRAVGNWAVRQKTPLGVVAQCGVLSMVFLGAIQTGNRLAAEDAGSLWLQIAWMIAIVLGLHLFMLLLALGLGRAMRLARADRIAAGFAGSQKSCMVGLEVCAQLGVTMLPMVAYHVGQLLVDTVIADRLRRSADGRVNSANGGPAVPRRGDRGGTGGRG